MVDTILEIILCVVLGALGLLIASLCIIGIVLLIKFTISTFKDKDRW